MRPGAAAAVFLATACACGSGLFQQYEYEEEMYLSLDGAATIYVNSSLPALNALRGTAFDVRLDAPFDRSGVQAHFTTPSTRVTRITTSERQGRRFVHVRLDTDDVRTLGDRDPFDWSSYKFDGNGDLVVLRQHVGAPDRDGAVSAGFSGEELVAFRLHAPSRIVYHNAGADNLRRGNILVWEQPLAERMRGAPIEIDVRMEPESILYRTLWLFGASAVAVAAMFGAVIWWLTRRRETTP